VQVIYIKERSHKTNASPQIAKAAREGRQPPAEREAYLKHQMEWNLSQYCSLCGFLPPSLSPNSWGYTGIKGGVAVPRPSQISEYDRLMHQTMTYTNHRSPQHNEFTGLEHSVDKSQNANENAARSRTFSEDEMIENQMQDYLMQLVADRVRVENLTKPSEDDDIQKRGDDRHKTRSSLPSQEEVFAGADQIVDSSEFDKFPSDPESSKPSFKSLEQQRKEREMTDFDNDLFSAPDSPMSLGSMDDVENSVDILGNGPLVDLSSLPPLKRRKTEPHDSKMN
jgi:hypothetical protein